MVYHEIGKRPMLGDVFSLSKFSQPERIITNSDLNRPCFAWHPYGKSRLFKIELVIVL